jgi:hypothetical protein
MQVVCNCSLPICCFTCTTPYRLRERGRIRGWAGVDGSSGGSCQQGEGDVFRVCIRFAACGRAEGEGDGNASCCLLLGGESSITTR